MSQPVQFSSVDQCWLTQWLNCSNKIYEHCHTCWFCSQDDTNYNNKLQAISIYIDCLAFGLYFFVTVSFADFIFPATDYFYSGSHSILCVFAVAFWFLLFVLGKIIIFGYMCTSFQLAFLTVCQQNTKMHNGCFPLSLSLSLSFTLYTLYCMLHVEILLQFYTMKVKMTSSWQTTKYSTHAEIKPNDILILLYMHWMVRMNN